MIKSHKSSGREDAKRRSSWVSAFMNKKFCKRLNYT